jgi:hypothetical protein
VAAETGEFEDVIKAGVIDPAKVTRLALQNAASIVSLMLTTEVLIADLKEEEAVVAHAGGMGGLLTLPDCVQKADSIGTSNCAESSRPIDTLYVRRYCS